MNSNELERLRKVAWMDASGQAAVLSEPSYAGKPFVFAGLEACQIAVSSLAFVETMWGHISVNGVKVFDSQMQQVGEMCGSSLSFMNPGDLTAVCSRKHMYETTWQRASMSSPKERLSSTVMWDLDEEANSVWHVTGPLLVSSLSELSEQFLRSTEGNCNLQSVATASA